MTASPPEAFLSWFRSNSGSFHPNAQFINVPSGYSIVAKQEIPADETIVSCPFSLAITPQVANCSLVKLLGTKDGEELKGLTERQLVCMYLCFHEIVPHDSQAQYELKHKPYLEMLPSQEQLNTPLHFTSDELEEFRGSNIYRATLDREAQWKSEWEAVKILVEQSNKEWAAAFTWERYLKAATYLSSRAFPSTVLSSSPTLQSTPDSYPVLLPGIDSLNHGRAVPVSWIVSGQGKGDDVDNSATISIVLHRATASSGELLNNYGAKPNAEFILGYGFSIQDNPEDTIVLAIGDQRSQGSGVDGNKNKWEVGRDAKGAEGVWEEVLARVSSATQGDDETDDETGEEGDEDDENVRPAYEDELEAAQILAEMVQSLLDRLPSEEGGAQRAAKIRPEVATMLHDYLSGQKEILESLLKFACQKEAKAIEEAGEAGVELVFD
jgi:hypothetical protein